MTSSKKGSWLSEADGEKIQPELPSVDTARVALKTDDASSGGLWKGCPAESGLVITLFTSRRAGDQNPSREGR
jgi:hypothetical protein